MFMATLADWKARDAAERMMQDFQWAEEQAVRTNAHLEFKLPGNDCGPSEWSVTTQGGQNPPQVLRCMSGADFSSDYHGVTFTATTTGQINISPIGLVTPQFVVTFSSASVASAAIWLFEMTSAGRGEIVKG